MRRKRLSLLRIAAADLLGRVDLDEVGAGLSRPRRLGPRRRALRLAGAGDDVAVIAMGKHGACELNYASDVDVMFVAIDGAAADPATVQRTVAIAAGCFRIDANLRPEGRSGALVRSLDAYRAYWDRWARPWEFQALLKARFVAGDEALGAEFEQAATDRLWRRHFGADELSELRTMKARAESIVARPGLDARELSGVGAGSGTSSSPCSSSSSCTGHATRRFGCGARSSPSRELAGAGYVSPADAGAMALAYRFLRTVEHRLQLVEEAQVHTVPADRAARDRLARVLGFAGTASTPPVDRFDTVLHRHQAAARTIHERLYFRPLLEAFAGGSDRLAPGAIGERLAAFGFRDAERTRQALEELTRGLTRSSRLMQQLLPLVLDWLSTSPDPDQGLVGLRALAGAAHRRDLLVAAFRESPELARRLCLVLGTSRRLGEIVAQHPDLVPVLDDDAALAQAPPQELSRRARAGGRPAARAARAGAAELPRGRGGPHRHPRRHGRGRAPVTGASLARLGDGRWPQRCTPPRPGRPWRWSGWAASGAPSSPTGATSTCSSSTRGPRPTTRGGRAGRGLDLAPVERGGGPGSRRRAARWAAAGAHGS